MKAPSITIDRKLKTVTIVMALESALPSKSSGKTMVISSTRGLRTSAENYAHRSVCFTASVFYFPAKPAELEFKKDSDVPRLKRKPSRGPERTIRIDRRLKSASVSYFPTKPGEQEFKKDSDVPRLKRKPSRGLKERADRNESSSGGEDHG